ncbi:hypothetical protein ACTID9_10915 [Brevibacillus fluminis]|uniref:hypothetical protein n=1 Tax=Brevibacillus fluminis TaxID=511487 RepID=UPI003F89DBCE
MKLNNSIDHTLLKPQAAAVVFDKFCADTASLAPGEAGAIRIGACAGVSIVSGEEAAESGY